MVRVGQVIMVPLIFTMCQMLCLTIFLKQIDILKSRGWINDESLFLLATDRPSTIEFFKEKHFLPILKFHITIATEMKKEKKNFHRKMFFPSHFTQIKR